MAWGCICTRTLTSALRWISHWNPGWCLPLNLSCLKRDTDFGMQVKDVALITDTGCELLSNFTNTDQLIVVQ